MILKADELTGHALDWAVAKCEKFKTGEAAVTAVLRLFGSDNAYGYQPSSEPQYGDSIVDREQINTIPYKNGGYLAYQGDNSNHADIHGPTKLIAAMRLYVANKLGANINIPDDVINEEVGRFSLVDTPVSEMRGIVLNYAMIKATDGLCADLTMTELTINGLTNGEMVSELESEVADLFLYSQKDNQVISQSSNNFSDEYNQSLVMLDKEFIEDPTVIIAMQRFLIDKGLDSMYIPSKVINANVEQFSDRLASPIELQRAINFAQSMKLKAPKP